MKYSKIFGFCLIFLVCTILTSFPNAFSLDATYDVFPSKGTVETNILILVRPDDPGDNSNIWVYVLWDDIPVIKRMQDPIVNGTHKYRLDIEITPPRNLPYSSEGSHMITIIIENEQNQIIKKYYSFKITDFIPPDDENWWANLNPLFIESITGPQGEKGNNGSQGIIGMQGLVGKMGPIGPLGGKGDKGNKGDIGVQGPVGEQGIIGFNGTQGIQGETGDPYPIMIAYGSIFISIGSLVVVVVIFYRSRR